MKVAVIEFSSLTFAVSPIDNTPFESGKASIYKCSRNTSPSARMNKSLAKAVALMDQIKGAGWVSVRHHGMLEERYRVEVAHRSGQNMILEFDPTKNAMYHDCNAAHNGVCYHAFWVFAAYVAASEPNGEFANHFHQLAISSPLSNTDAKNFFTAVDALHFDGKEKHNKIDVFLLDDGDREMITDDTKLVLRYRQTDGEFSVPLASAKQTDVNVDPTAGVAKANEAVGDVLVFDREFTDTEKTRMNLNEQKVSGKILPKFIGVGKTKIETASLIRQLSKGKVITTMFYGDTGGGKTTLVEIIADQIKAPLYSINCSKNMEELDILGGFVPDETGKFSWVDAEFTKAFRDGGVVLMDEFNNLNAGVAGVLNNALDHVGKLVLRNGEVIRRHPNFRFFAAVNLSYAGTNKMNLAMINRMNRSYQIEDLERKEQLSIVMNETGYKNQLVVDKLLDIKDAIASKFRNEQTDDSAISIRNVIDWVHEALETRDLIAASLPTVVWKACMYDNDVQKEIYEDIVVAKLRGVQM